MSATVTIIEDTNGACHLVVAGPDSVLVVPLDADQAIDLGRALLDGGQAPTVQVGR